MIFEPGRSLVGRAGLTLYRIGVVKRTTGVAYAAIDGGMSDNPRPQLYGSRYEALLANRADEEPVATFRIAGKHCESGDVLIDSVELPEPRRDDLLAVPATGRLHPRDGVELQRRRSPGRGARDRRRRRADPQARVARRPARVRDLEG